MASAHNGLSQPLPDVRLNACPRFLPAAGHGTAAPLHGPQRPALGKRGNQATAV